jgi:AcrR family transcriptional regulator
MTRARRSKSKRREDALSRDQIIAAAIELLDEKGEAGLTFRALATRLATGAGALYWHIANKHELLMAAADAVVSRAIADPGARTTPRKTIHRIAGALFDMIDARPWVVAQLTRAPAGTATLQIFERVGRQVQSLGVAGGAELTAASALVGYIIGVSVQNAANGRVFQPPADRTAVLAKESARWKDFDAHEYPFLRSVATQLPKHDDRAEFLSGVELILAGIAAQPKA